MLRQKAYIRQLKVPLRRCIDTILGTSTTGRRSPLDFLSRQRRRGIERNAAVQSARPRRSSRRPSVRVVELKVAGAGRGGREVSGAAVFQQSAHVGFLSQAAELLSGRLVVAELIADDGACVGDQSFDDVFLELQGEVQVRPCLVAVLECRHSEDEIVHILDIAVPFAFVAEA